MGRCGGVGDEFAGVEVEGDVRCEEEVDECAVGEVYEEPVTPG